MRHLHPIIFTFTGKPTADGSPGATHTVGGWIVPNTEQTLAIDMLSEMELTEDGPSFADWAITHLPTGFMVNKGEYTISDSSESAIKKAQRFYQVSRRLGIDMHSSDVQVIVGPWNELGEKEKKAAWIEVAGWPTP